jgi:hypothetical protein
LCGFLISVIRYENSVRITEVTKLLAIDEVRDFLIDIEVPIPH